VTCLCSYNCHIADLEVSQPLNRLHAPLGSFRPHARGPIYQPRHRAESYLIISRFPMLSLCPYVFRRCTRPDSSSRKQEVILLPGVRKTSYPYESSLGIITHNTSCPLLPSPLFLSRLTTGCGSGSHSHVPSLFHHIGIHQ
jgi:hypothetical protein